jgi:hypothetical protein
MNYKKNSGKWYKPDQELNKLLFHEMCVNRLYLFGLLSLSLNKAQ